MIEAVGVRFKCAGTIYYFSPNGEDVKINNKVIVETSRGLEYGTCVTEIKHLDEEELVSPLKNILRIATDEDKITHNQNKIKAMEAKEICRTKIKEHGLDMSLVSSEYTFDNSKLIFNFTADDRIDFRDLVRDLASIFKTRIELRQIGVRDQAKTLGALGCCGRETCCSTFLCDFAPVTINMAKDQSYSLNPTKISGVCGRLMCCLKYEQDGYERALKEMPNIGDEVMTDFGKGTVLQLIPLKGIVKVKIVNDDEITQEYISNESIKVLG